MSDVEKVNEIFEILDRIIQPNAYGQWFDLPIPALQNRIPRDLINDDLDGILAHVRGYLNTSYT